MTRTESPAERRWGINRRGPGRAASPPLPSARKPYSALPGRSGVVDIQETPAVPPFDTKGDPRLGYFVAGGLLVVLGWVLGVVLNVLLHVYAPSGGLRIYGVYFGHALGPYAWATLGLGLFTGAFGVVLLALGRSSPSGPFVLPGADY